MAFLDQIFYGNSLHKWFAALATAAGVLVGARILIAIVVSHLATLSKRTQNPWDDAVFHALRKTKMLLLILASAYAGSFVLQIDDTVAHRLTRLLITVLWLQIGIWAAAGFQSWLESYRERRLAKDPSAAPVITAAGYAGRILLWIVILLLILDNVGVKVTALIAGLGVGGIAIALAIQNILGDVLASLSIIIDKPFIIGDFLTVGEHMGSVETIGLKTTRLRSLSGEQLVFPNNDLLSSRIRNYGRMAERRVVFSIGVTYQTPREKLERIPQILREVIETQEKVRFDRSHFKAYGEFSIGFETVYYVLVPDYTIHMDVQQAINLKIHERFEKEGIEFAYPTQTLHLVKTSD